MTNGELERLVRQLRRLVVYGLFFAITICLSLLGSLVLLRRPFKQLDSLASFNRDFVAITCDTTLYSQEELARRTPEARRRLTRVCEHRSPR